MAWHAEEVVRQVYGIDDPDLATELVTLGADLQDESCPPEIRRLGRTIVRWRDQIAAWHRSRVSNGPTEAVNNLTKRVKRVAFGFRRFTNCRIRALLYAGRPNWDLLATVTPRRFAKWPRTTAVHSVVRERAAMVRAQTMGGVASDIAAAGTGPATKTDRPEIVGYVRESLLGQTDEGYAVACEAAADSVDADQAQIRGPVLVITGSADGVSPPEKAEHIASGFADAQVEVIDGIGHWTVVEAGKQVGSMIADFLT